MNIVIAIDSFKGSLTSLKAGNAAADGIKRVYPDAHISVRPLADGGEGTVEALALGMNGRLKSIEVCGPLGKSVACTYGLIDATRTAIIEMSGAAGITLVPATERDPLHTTTYGVGEVIKDAVREGCRDFIVGIGGSATNDGGAGMLQALGFGLSDTNGRPIRRGAIGLGDLCTINTDNVLPELDECRFSIACDVTNPLCGDKGCSAVFGPQKGATHDMIRDMDNWLSDYAGIARSSFPEADPSAPGTGAAGGLGFAFRTFMNAELISGVRLVLEKTGLEGYIRDADIVITGEGRLDSQTVMGKAPYGVAQIAKKYSKPVIAFSGCVTPDATVCNEHGIDAFFPILRRIVTLDEALSGDIAYANLADTAEQAFRLIKAVRL